MSFFEWFFALSLPVAAILFLIHNELKINKIGKSMNMGYRMRDLFDDRLWGLSILVLCILFNIILWGYDAKI